MEIIGKIVDALVLTVVNRGLLLEVLGLIVEVLGLKVEVIGLTVEVQRRAALVQERKQEVLKDPYAPEEAESKINVSNAPVIDTIINKAENGNDEDEIIHKTPRKDREREVSGTFVTAESGPVERK